MKSISFRGAIAGVVAVLLLAPAAPAQSATGRFLAGAVVLGEDPVAGVPVTLHRVTASASGPLGDRVTDRDGSFRFSLPAADTAGFEVFFVTAEYRSVRYFGQPVHGAASLRDYTVAVYDTASALPGALRVARRDIVLLPETQGGWEANEIVRLHNSADRTLVSRGGMPTWELRLPEGVTDFQAGEGELTAAEITLMGDRVLLLASLTPGGRELFLRYRIPVGLESAGLDLATATDTLNLFVGQPSPAIEVTGLTTTKVVDVQGERFVQYGGTGLAQGEEVRLEWSAPAAPPVAPEVAGGVAALLVLLTGSWIALRNRTSPASAGDGSPIPG